MLTFQQERMHDAYREIERLVPEHWSYVTTNEWPADVDWEAMLRLEDIGILRLMVARNAGELVGYAVFLLAPALHYKGKLFAHDDAFFLSAPHRKGGNGFKLFKAAETMLREAGVDRIVCHEKFTKVDLSTFFKHLGYRVSERNWFKDLT